MPLTSDTANGEAGDEVFVAAAAAYVRRQTTPRAIAAGDGNPARSARCWREAATALRTGCLMSILPKDEGTTQPIDVKERGAMGGVDRQVPGMGWLCVASA